MQRSKIQDVSFTDFLRTDPVYADKNQYQRTYRLYAEALGAQNVLVLFYEDLRRDPADVIMRCLSCAAGRHVLSNSPEKG